MLNKRKKHINPTRINNYNKFLTTIDKNTTFHISNCSISSSETEKKDEITINSMIDKLKLDKIVDNISNNYTVNYNSSSFTGQTKNDIFMAQTNIEDPNEYKELLSNNDICCLRYKKYVYKNKLERNPQVEPNIKIKETIIIDVIIDEEINNIGDIIKLTEKYKLDSGIKYNINMKALHNIKEPLEELNNMIGMTELKSNIVNQILYFVQELHKNKNDSGEFMHTVIYGPPGTGKTEIAKMMGKIYSKIGILKKGTFKKVTRSDLIAGYLGQTALKTHNVIKEALGGVLFIDEAYALGNPEKKDSFSKECIDTLCEALSDNKENLMVIIAGYETELKECFFNYNQGLDSRFTWRFKTDNYSAEDLHKIFVKKVKDIGWELQEESKITVEIFKKNHEYLKFFGRDIETILAKTKIAHSKRVFCKPENEKKKITIKDLEKGFEMYLKNDDIKNRKDSEYMKKQLYNSLYS
jgi:Holliday junction resolvasome RuvABC ATP-dependent DNA helicase subunit